MNRKTLFKHAKRLALGLAALAMAATPSFAQTSYDLCASDGTVTMPDSTVVPIWGYANITGGAACTAGLATLPGPELRLLASDGTLTINLTNALAVPVSFFVPGYRSTVTGGSPGLFTGEVLPGSTATYTISVRAGTYLYHSGTDITTQVPMGLYGALVVDSAAGEAYPGITYDQDEVLLYSQIDPNLNADPAGFGGARVINWNPQYFLINGEAQPSTSDLSVNTSEDVLLRFVNAGLETFVPSLDGGLYMDLLAEDGNRYPQPLQQYGIELQAGKTIDAMVNAGSGGSYALYDRAASYDSGVTNIVAGAVVGAPTALDDAYAVDEDGSLTADGVAPNPNGVLFNDSAGTGGTMTAALVSDASAGTLVLAADGTFTYTPNADYSGVEFFSYLANDGGPDSNVATVTITVNPVNDAPVANAVAYNAIVGQTLSVDAPGVLWNDTDADGDTLTASATGTPPPGVLTLSADGSFDYTPAGAAGAVETFDYVANDGAVDSAAATVTITVIPEPANVAPFANDDFAETTKNSAGITFSVTANDVDADGTVDPATVVITTGPNTQRAGTVVANVDGTVTYVPKRGFRGTDTFQYQVNDNDGATSNVATVRVNVK
jgi:FtsP/CotA-like multicopper oxidase with cupredoxin domain